MVYSTSNEQGCNFKIWGTNWISKDYKGLILIQNPFPKEQTDLNSKSGYKSKYSRFSANKNHQDLSPISLNGEQQELFAVIDLETTGLDIRKDSILEIGVILGNYTEIIEKRSSLIKGESKISEEITSLTGLTDSDIHDNGIELRIALIKLSKLTEGLTVVFHNSKFDLKFLSKSYKDLGLKMPKWLIQDTWLLAKAKLKNLNDYRLETVCTHLGCRNMPNHRALSDCEATWEVFTKLKNL